MAQSAELQRLITNVLVGCPGSDKKGVQAVFFDTLRDFCFWTNVWQNDVDVAMVPNVRSYTLNVAQGSTIVRALRLYNSTDAAKRPAAGFTMPSPPAIMLDLAPNTSATMVCTVALQPLDPVNEDGDPVGWPAWIAQKYFDVLQSGVMGRLMSQVAKPFTSTTMALFHMRKYQSGRANAAREVYATNLSGVQVWRYPGNFAPGGRQSGV